MKKESKRSYLQSALLITVILFFTTALTTAQTFNYSSSPSNPPSSNLKWLIGGKIGLAIGSGFGGSSVGMLLGPMAEVMFNKNMAVGTELNINTFGGTPIEWADYFKYYFDIPNSNIHAYGNGGVSLWFASGGPYFGIRFGGGANFKVANNLYIPADLQLGPVFYSTKSTGFDYNTFQYTTTSKTTTIFYVTITTGIRYEIP